MSRKTWILTDITADEYIDEISICPEDVEIADAEFSVSKRTLRGGLREGVDFIEVDNGRLWFAVVPTRGMGIWGAICDDVHLGWASPVDGPVNPEFVPTWEPSGIGWLSGFDELLVRCGLENNGAPEFRPDGTLQWPLHGKIANTPAHHVEVEIDANSGEIIVRGTVVESRLFGVKLRLVSTITTKVDQPWFTVTDEVTNLSALPGELELLYHINFGLPLVTKGAGVIVPAKRMAPRDAVAAAEIDRWNVYEDETPGRPEACYFFDPASDADGHARALLHSADKQQGVSVKFNTQQLPYFTLWKLQQAAADGYVTGLEPSINFPNPRSFEKEKGRVAVLQPSETRCFELTIEAHADADAVAAAEREIAAIQEAIEPEICTAPNPEWSAS